MQVKNGRWPHDDNACPSGHLKKGRIARLDSWAIRLPGLVLAGDFHGEQR